MPGINPSLLAKIKKALNIGKSRAYKLIEETVGNRHLPRRIAALIVASEAGVNIAPFAAESDLALMRSIGQSPSLPPVSSGVTAIAPHRASRKSSAKPNKKAGDQVFVVYGRNDRIRKALFAFLRSLHLHPIEWNRAVSLTKQGSPYIGQVLDAAFAKANVIIVLFTPDDEARLKPEFVKPGDPAHEKKLTGQSRPNVLFEAGMAFGRQPSRTILVEVGKLRPFSDVGGRHVVHLSNSMSSRQQLVSKLRTSGLNVDDIGEDWHTEGDFTLIKAKP